MVQFMVVSISRFINEPSGERHRRLFYWRGEVAKEWAKAFYKTARWLSKRSKILRRDEYMCQQCKRYGKTTPATTVHHIIPLMWCLLFNKALALAGINLTSLCEECHNKMHDRLTNRLTALGLEWVKRMGEAGLKWIKEYAGQW